MTAAEPEKQLELQSMTITAEAQLVKVVDQRTLEYAGSFLTDRIKPLLNEANGVFDPVIATAHAAHKAALAAKAKIVTPLLEAEKVLKHATGRYLVHQENLRRDEQLRIRAEEERREREARAEARRLQEESDRAHAEQIEAQIIDAEAKGADASHIERLAATPAPVVVVPEPVFMPSPVVASRVQPVAGISTSERWSAEVSSIRQLAAAVVAETVPEELLIGLEVKEGKVSSPALNKLASALKSALSVPGVRAVKSTFVNARSK